MRARRTPLFPNLTPGEDSFVGVKKVKKVGPPEKAIEQGSQIPRALRGKS